MKIGESITFFEKERKQPMAHVICGQQLEKLFEAARDDTDLLGMISDCMKSLEEYHRAIFEMETWLKLYSHKNLSREDYQVRITESDNRRTICHNAVLASVNILNRIAAQYDVSPIYDGEISEKHPYRREVADAVLYYIDSVIVNRA